MEHDIVAIELTPEVLTVVPSMTVGAVVVDGLLSAASRMNAATDRLVSEIKLELPLRVRREAIAENDLIRGWRETFRAFRIAPKFRSSVEQLARRYLRDGRVATGVGIVDYYCAVSSRELATLGGYDLARLPSATVELRLQRATDRFHPLGSFDIPASAPAAPVYVAAGEVLCWGLNVRDSMATSLQPTTDTALFVTEAATRDQRLAGSRALARLCNDMTVLGCSVGTPVFASAATPTIELAHTRR